MSRVLIAGCGFVGLAAARLFQAAGWEVRGVTHSAESAAALAGEAFPVLAADLTDREALATLGDWFGCDAAIHCASSGRGGAGAYRRVYLEGARNLADGGCVARLAGIYGPGRSVLLKKFLTGEAVIEGDGARWINQAQRDDIAAALLQLVTSGARGVFNVSDDTPMTQRAVYEGLAAHLHRPLPPSGPIDPHRKRGWTSKRVNNAKLRALGWMPRYPSFFDAIANDPELLQAAAS